MPALLILSILVLSLGLSVDGAFLLNKLTNALKRESLVDRFAPLERIHTEVVLSHVTEKGALRSRLWYTIAERHPNIYISNKSDPPIIVKITKDRIRGHQEASIYRSLMGMKWMGNLIEHGNGNPNEYVLVMDLHPDSIFSLNDVQSRLRAARDVIDAVIGMHGLGIVHGQLSSKHFRVGVDGLVKMIDFSMARRSRDTSKDVMDLAGCVAEILIGQHLTSSKIFLLLKEPKLPHVFSTIINARIIPIQLSFMICSMMSGAGRFSANHLKMAMDGEYPFEVESLLTAYQKQLANSHSSIAVPHPTFFSHYQDVVQLDSHMIVPNNECPDLFQYDLFRRVAIRKTVNTRLYTLTVFKRTTGAQRTLVFGDGMLSTIRKSHPQLLANPENLSKFLIIPTDGIASLNCEKLERIRLDNANDNVEAMLFSFFTDSINELSRHGMTLSVIGMPELDKHLWLAGDRILADDLPNLIPLSGKGPSVTVLLAALLHEYREPSSDGTDSE